MEAEYQVCKDITFISEEQITNKCWAEAKLLVENVDVKDIHYVAYARNLNARYGLVIKNFLLGFPTKDLRK